MHMFFCVCLGNYVSHQPNIDYMVGCALLYFEPEASEFLWELSLNYALIGIWHQGLALIIFSKCGYWGLTKLSINKE